MKRKSHYTILGIPRGESQKGIRAAYLHLAKALHPDRAGEAGTQAFREVQRAYDVLSDPESRSSYDKTLEPKRRAQVWQAEPLTRHHRAEPLVPVEGLATQEHIDQRAFMENWFEAMMADVSPIGSYLPPTKSIDLDVVLSSDQAARGGGFTVAVPVEQPCRRCTGTGVDRFFPCLACHQGTTVGKHVFRLHIPAGVPHGTVIHLQPGNSGDGTVRVRLLVDRRLRAPPSW